MATIQPARASKRPQYVKKAFIAYVRRGVVVVQSWPTARGLPTDSYQRSIIDRFREVVRFVKRMGARETTTRRAAVERYNNSIRGQLGSAAIRDRDVATMQLTGRFGWIELDNGRKIHSAAARQDISEALDWAEPQVGSMLHRSERGWTCTVPCTPGWAFRSTAPGDSILCCPPARPAFPDEVAP